MDAGDEVSNAFDSDEALRADLEAALRRQSHWALGLVVTVLLAIYFKS